jgi:upstream activation factor subunit UAF30
MATKTAKKATKKAAPAAKSKSSKAAPAAKSKSKAPAAKSKSSSKAAAPKAKKAAKRKPNPALMKPLQPDAVLSVVVGSKPLARGQIVKKLWEYIKKKGLQDAKNKRNINADDALKAVFNGKKQVSMFEMTKLVSGHIK